MKPVSLVGTLLDTFHEARSLDAARVGDMILGCSTGSGDQEREHRQRRRSASQDVGASRRRP